MHCLVIVRTSSGPKALEPRCFRAKRFSEVDSSCRLLILPLLPGSSKFESLIVSHHSRFTCECDKEEIYDDNDECQRSSRYVSFDKDDYMPHLSGDASATAMPLKNAFCAM